MTQRVGRHARRWWRKHLDEIDGQHDGGGDRPRRRLGYGAQVTADPPWTGLVYDVLHEVTQALPIVRSLVGPPPVTQGERHRLDTVARNAQVSTQGPPMTRGQESRASETDKGRP